MGLDSSPSCCSALPLHQFFLYHSVSPPPSVSPLPSVSPPPSVSPSLCTVLLYFYCYPTLSFFPALTFFPLFVSISPLFYNFLPRLYFYYFLSLFSLISTISIFPFYFSIYISYWFDFSLSPSLSIFSHDHPNYFKFSVIPTSAISQDWHLVTDYSILPYCDVPGSIR